MDDGTMRNPILQQIDTKENMTKSDYYDLPKDTIGKAEKLIYIIAVLIILNIVFVPFLVSDDWLIGDILDAYTFFEVIEDLNGNYHDWLSLDVLYYLGHMACAVFVLISIFFKSAKACVLGSFAGIGLSLFVFYQIYLRDAGQSWVHLSFGYYITLVGFISMLIASFNVDSITIKGPKTV